MAKIFYDDDEPKGGFNPRLARDLNPTSQYLKHYSNQLYLSFLITRSDNPVERYQARKEMSICERKLEYWRRRPGFDQDVATAGADRLKKDWTGGR